MDDELSLRDAISGVLRGLSDKKAWQETGEALGRTQKVLPNVAESLVRGGVAAVPGTIGDINELIVDHIGSAFPNAPKAPTTRDILDYVPRVTADHEGSKTMEDVGGFIGPGMAGVAGDVVRATKGMKAGLSIENVGNETTQALRQVKPAKPEPYRAPRNEMGFYSALDEAVGNIQSPRGTGEQYLKQLQKTPGVKAEEITYRGLDKFLAENPKTSVEDIKKYLADNQVNLEQKTLKGQNASGSYDDFTSEFEGGLDERAMDDMIYEETDYYRSEYADEWRKEYMDDRGITEEDLADNPSIEREIENHIDERANDYAQESARENAPYEYEHPEHGYRVTGNDNYGWSMYDHRGNLVGDAGGHRSQEDALDAARDHALDWGHIDIDGGGEGVQYDNWKLKGADDSYRENLIHHESTAGDFDAPHFDGHSENLLMHNRLTDRVDSEGKKALFSEEMQSDWLQKGRNEGFRNADEQSELIKQISALRDEKERQLELAKPYTDAGNDAPSEITDAYTSADDRMNALKRQVEQLRRLVPDAPFKKTYHEFLAKKNLNDAVEGGYDRFAWSPGKIHADRYGMNKHVDDVRYYPEVNALEAFKDKQHVLSKTLDKPEDLDMYLGKEFAQRLRETPPTVNPDTGVQYHSLAGEPLDIGDRRAAGMRNYYDEKVPNFLSSHLKKYGVKPGTTQVEGKDVHYVDITPEMREEFLKRGQPMFALAPLAVPALQDDEQPTTADMAAALRRKQ